MSWLVPRNELTLAQTRAVEASPDQHRLVLGSPGSGKTIVLAHRARHLIDSGWSLLGRYRLLVFTKALEAYIRAALIDLKLPVECVTTFDAWCGDYYRKYVNKRMPRGVQGVDWDAVRLAVWKHTRKLHVSDQIFDFVMVDEGQDLDRRDFETLTSISRHVTVFMDPKQKLYQRDADEESVARVLGLPCRNAALLGAYRCSPYIVSAGAAFIRDAKERKQFIEQHPPFKRGVRHRPLLYLANGADDEKVHLIDLVRTRIDRNERIAILLPTNRHVFGYAKAFHEVGLEVEVNLSGRKKKDHLRDSDFNSTLPKLMPIPSSKGLTFDTVLMPRFNRRFVEKVDRDRLERWLFVGITRATTWFAISTTDGDSAMYIERFRNLAEEDQMTIQSASEEALPRPRVEADVDRDRGRKLGRLFS